MMALRHYDAAIFEKRMVIIVCFNILFAVAFWLHLAMVPQHSTSQLELHPCASFGVCKLAK